MSGSVVNIFINESRSSCCIEIHFVAALKQFLWCDVEFQPQLFFISCRVIKYWAALNDNCVGELEGVDQNIDPACKSFIVKPNVQESNIYLKCSSHTQKPWPTRGVVSLSLCSMCVFPWLGRGFSPTHSVCLDPGEETGRLEWQMGNGPHFFMALSIFDCDYCTTWRLVMDSQ